MSKAEDFEPLELDGELSCTFYKDGGVVFREQNLSFTMRLWGPNRWGMSQLDPSGQGMWERGCNGTDVFNVFLLPPLGRRGVPADVEHGVVPAGSYPTRLPWLAFASSAFLRTNSAFPAPWADAYEPNAHIDDVEVRYSQVAHGIPEAIDWYLSTNKVNSLSENLWLACSDRWPKDKLERWTADEPGGFLSATYRALAYTNIGHLVLPARFELTRYRRGGAPHGVTNFPVSALYKGQVRELRLTSAVARLPELPTNEPIYVSDYRFRDKRTGLNGIECLITNQAWIEDAGDSKLRALFEVQKREKLSRDRYMGVVAALRGIATLRVLVPLLIVAALIWLVWWSGRRD